MRNKLIITLVAFMLAPHLSAEALSQLPSETVSESKSLTPEHSFSYTDGKYNYKAFAVDVPSDGDYFAEFWLLPATYPDGNHTTFTVTVNDEKVGQITTDIENWHSASIDGKDRIRLNKGANIVCVAVKAPETPMVETVRIAEFYEDAAIHSQKYYDYLAKIESVKSSQVKTRLPYKITEEKKCTVPLRYSFYNKSQFDKGDDIFISSSSAVSHCIDVVYYSDLYLYSVISNPDRPIFPGFPRPGQVLPSSLKMIEGEPATLDEMQGLNWTGESEINDSTSSHEAIVKIKVPKKGTYLIYIRNTNNNVLSTVTLNVNGKYLYKNQPTASSYIAHRQDADGLEYMTITQCTDSLNCDPFIFIHGNDANRIVAFNDDGKYSVLQQYGFYKLESCMICNYNIPTSGISVTSYSSLYPDSECTVWSGYLKDDILQKRRLNKSYENNSDIANSIKRNCDISIPASVKLGATVQINATENIKVVRIYSVSGMLLYSKNCGNNSFSYSTSEIGISDRGIYIIQIETDSEIVSDKISVI